MKKLITVTVLIVLSLLLCACGGDVSDVTVNYGESELYSQKDMEMAVEVIKQEFSSWDGCKLYTIEFTNDEICISEGNYYKVNPLKYAEPYDECIVFVSSFRSAKNGGDGFEADCEYADWNWILVREYGGKWSMLTWGY